LRLVRNKYNKLSSPRRPKQRPGSPPEKTRPTPSSGPARPTQSEASPYAADEERSSETRPPVEGGAVPCCCSDENETEERQELAPCMTASTHKASSYEAPHSGVPGHPLRQHLRCPSPFPPGKQSSFFEFPILPILLRGFCPVPFFSFPFLLDLLMSPPSWDWFLAGAAVPCLPPHLVSLTFSLLLNWALVEN
jgi:hypothetical protein